MSDLSQPYELIKMPLLIEIFWQNGHKSPEHELTWSEKVPFIPGERSSIPLFIRFSISLVFAPLRPLMWLICVLILVFIVWAAPVPVILLPLVLIGQYLIGHLHLLELLFENILLRCWVAIWGVCMVFIWIRVVKLRHFVICLLDFWLCRLRTHFQNAVQVHVTVVSESVWELSEYKWGWFVPWVLKEVTMQIKHYWQTYPVSNYNYCGLI